MVRPRSAANVRLFTVFTALSTLAKLVACQAPDIATFDDSDPNLKYSAQGWIPNPGNDPEGNNYMSTLTFTSTTGADVVFTFTGMCYFRVSTLLIP